MKQKLPPFDVHSKLHYWLSYKYSDEITIALAIKGKLKIDILKTAIKDIYESTPVLQTHIIEKWKFVTRKLNKSFKNIDIDALLTIDNNEKKNPGNINGKIEESTLRFINQPINYLNDPPVKFFLSKKNKSEYLFFIKIHHSVSDAFGEYILASKIIQRYNILLEHKNSIILPGEPENYSMFPLKKILQKKKSKPKSKNLQSMSKISFFRDKETMDGTIKNHAFSLDESEFKKLQNITKKTKLSINDLLLAAIVRTTYKTINGRKAAIDQLRFIQTANLRKYLDIQGGIGNISSFYHASFHEKDLEDYSATLNTVLLEKNRTRDEQESIRNVFSLNFFKILPSKITRNIIKSNDSKIIIKQPQLTGMITNAGRLDNILEEPKDCKITYTWLLTPVHFSYGMQWFISSINDVLTINISYLDPVITEKTSAQLVKDFQKELDGLLKVNFTKLKNYN